MGFDDLVAQARAVGDEYFELFLAFLLLLVQHLVVGVQTSFTLGLASLGGHAHPFQLALQGFASLRCYLFFLLHALGLLFQPAGVVTLPGDALAAVEFQNPAGHVVEEVAVVGYADDSAFVLLKVLLEPVDAFGIQVVGGLVEEKDVGLLQQQTAQGNPTAFAA